MATQPQSRMRNSLLRHDHHGRLLPMAREKPTPMTILTDPHSHCTGERERVSVCRQRCDDFGNSQGRKSMASYTDAGRERRRQHRDFRRRLRVYFNRAFRVGCHRQFGRSYRTVVELYFGRPGQPPLTEISGTPTVTLLSTGNPLPVPITLTAATQPGRLHEQLESDRGHERFRSFSDCHITDWRIHKRGECYGSR